MGFAPLVGPNELENYMDVLARTRMPPNWLSYIAGSLWYPLALIAVWVASLSLLLFFIDPSSYTLPGYVTQAGLVVTVPVMLVHVLFKVACWFFGRAAGTWDLLPLYGFYEAYGAIPAIQERVHEIRSADLKAEFVVGIFIPYKSKEAQGAILFQVTPSEEQSEHWRYEPTVALNEAAQPASL